MANLMAEVQGSRGAVHRLGHTNIRATVNGWNSGVLVKGVHVDGGDIFDIYATGGSNGHKPTTYLGTVSLNRNGELKFTTPEEYPYGT